MIIKTDYTTDDTRTRILDWILHNDHLKAFDNPDGSTRREAFSIAYHSDTLPDWLKCFETGGVNVYNFIAIATYNSGEIDPHVDDDLVHHMRELNIPGIYISLPQSTCVYYVDICEHMIGGELICGDDVYVPIINSCVELSRGEVHSVRAIESCDQPRVVLVCEHYRILPPAIKLIQLGEYREG